MGIRGLNKKSKKTVLSSATWRTDGQKWLDSIEKISNLKQHHNRQTDGDTDRVNNKKIIDS